MSPLRWLTRSAGSRSVTLRTSSASSACTCTGTCTRVEQLVHPLRWRSPSCPRPRGRGGSGWRARPVRRMSSAASTSSTPRDVVGRVDDHRLAGLAVADQVDEVDHLAGQRVVAGDVAPGEQLAEVEPRRRRRRVGGVAHLRHSRPIRAHLGRGHRCTPRTMVPPPEALPDVLPTDRLTATGMPRPFLREHLRRIPNGRNVLNVASVWVQTMGVLALACWVTPRLPLAAALAVWARRLPPRRPGLRPVLDPRPRGRPPPAVLPPAGQRPRRSVAARVPGVRALRRLPPQPLLPPPRRARARRARPQPLPRATRSPGPRSAASCAATPSGCSGWKNLKGLLKALGKPTSRPVAAAHRRHPGRAGGGHGRCCRAAGGCGRCCGWPPG